MRSLDEYKELKVTLPADLHGKLRIVKILHGQTIAATVTLALDQYFAAAADPEPPRQQKLVHAAPPQ